MPDITDRISSRLEALRTGRLSLTNRDTLEHLIALNQDLREALERTGGQTKPSLGLTVPTPKEVLADEDVHYWLKDALRVAIAVRDPQEAAIEALHLMQVLHQRAVRVLAGHWDDSWDGK